MKLIKHLGQLANTTTRVAIIFHRIPGRPDHALVTEVDSLPDRIKDPLENILLTEGQQYDELYKILSRRLMPDNNKSILVELHERGYLKPVPQKNIIFNVGRGKTVSFDKVLEELEKIYASETSSLKSDTPVVEYKTTPTNDIASVMEHEGVVIENTDTGETKMIVRESHNIQPSHSASVSVNSFNDHMEKLVLLIEKMNTVIDKMNVLLDKMNGSDEKNNTNEE